MYFMIMIASLIVRSTEQWKATKILVILELRGFVVLVSHQSSYLHIGRDLQVDEYRDERFFHYGNDQV